MDVIDHAHHTLYDRAYFVGLIFMVSRLFVKIGPLESFPLYGSHNTSTHTAARVRSHDTTALILYYGWGLECIWQPLQCCHLSLVWLSVVTLLSLLLPYRS